MQGHPHRGAEPWDSEGSGPAGPGRAVRSGERPSAAGSGRGDAQLAELDRSHRHLRLAAAAIDPVAAEEGWPSPFSPVRLLVLRHLGTASPLGTKPARIAWVLEMKRSSLAHHLDVLEGAGMIVRRPRGWYDGRRVAVRLTERGAYALRRLASALPPTRMSA